MRVLIYKRTHPFDQSADGVFGCQDCMGTEMLLVLIRLGA
jgi:hypothetical protein